MTVGIANTVVALPFGVVGGVLAFEVAQESALGATVVFTPLLVGKASQTDPFALGCLPSAAAFEFFVLSSAALVGRFATSHTGGDVADRTDLAVAEAVFAAGAKGWSAGRGPLSPFEATSFDTGFQAVTGLSSAFAHPLFSLAGGLLFLLFAGLQRVLARGFAGGSGFAISCFALSSFLAVPGFAFFGGL